MDPRVAALLEDLRSPEEARAEGAREALEALGAGAVPSLAGLLRDGDERVRAAALGMVARHGDGSPSTLREVVRGAQAALRSFESHGAAAEVHEAILGLQEPLEALVPALLRELAAPEAEVRLAAARDLETLTHYLGASGAEEAEILAALRGALRDAEPHVRWWAAGSLGNLSLDPGACVADLVLLLDDPGAAVRAAALEALERFGPDALPAAPAILRILDGSDEEFEARAVLVAARTGRADGTVHQAVAARVTSPRARVRAAACAALGELGNAPREAQEALAAATRDPDEEVRKSAVWALERIRAIHGS